MKKIISTFAILFTILVPGVVFAQGSGGSGNDQSFLMIAIFTVLGLTIIVLVAVILSLQTLKRTLFEEQAKRLAETGGEVQVYQSWWSKISSTLWNIKPVEKEADIMLDHDYDGIKELDNHLPPWWTYLFYLTIVFAVVYLLIYHVFNISPLSIEEYENEMAAAEEQAATRKALLSEEGGVSDVDIQFTDNAEDLASGEKIFQMQCMACHRPDGGGLIGPNLTDEYWLHGGTMSEIYNTIKVGVPAKGMISWEPVLSPQEIRDVASYIITIQGSNPENPKAPQGDKFEGDQKGIATS